MMYRIENYPDKYEFIGDKDVYQLLPPEIILPTQWENPRGKIWQCPEYRLVMAVFKNALKEFLKKKTRKRALAWFQDEDTEWPYSSENICRILGLNRTWILRLLINLENEEKDKLPATSIS